MFTSGQVQLEGYQWFGMAESFLSDTPEHSLKRSVINHAKVPEHCCALFSLLLHKYLFTSLEVVKR